MPTGWRLHSNVVLLALIVLAGGSSSALSGALRANLREPSRAPAQTTPRTGPDLAVDHVDRSGTSGDWQTLRISGRLSAVVENRGDVPVTTPFEVRFFEDRDADAAFDPTVDVPLALTTVDALDAGADATTVASVSDFVLFRDNVVHVVVDSAGTVHEVDESNNVARTRCAFQPPPAQFAPRLEWSWSGGEAYPESNQVIAAPAVADLTDDGLPDIVFVSYYRTAAGQMPAPPYLRAISGADGSEVFTVTDSEGAVYHQGGVAIGDIDLDGRPEIVTVAKSQTQLLAFEHDGTLKWRSQGNNRFGWGGPAIADLDGDTVPEIVAGATVYNSDGSVRWRGDEGRGQNAMGPLSLVADLDMDGSPEVMAGNTAYRADGSVFWRAPVDDGFNAVADFDADSYPEVVLVSLGRVYLLEHDGRVKWGPTDLPTGMRGTAYAGGAPTVADVDGDGELEIGVASSTAYVVLETDGSVKWSRKTQDESSGMTGSTVFDFEGDGLAEIIYGDELTLRIYRGMDGEVLWETQSPSNTTFEQPLVVDVDADGNAEIVMVSNNELFTGRSGIQVYGDANDTWVATRRIWNQHTYHISNVNDNGSIPAVETPSWLTHNTYRLNLPIDGDPLAAPDLTASRITIGTRADSRSVRLTARIGNGGSNHVAAGLPIAFYDGDPARGAPVIAVTATSRILHPGEFEDVTITWREPSPGPHTVFVWADDDGTGRGTASECDETNNAHHILAFAPTATPTVTSSPTPSPVASPTATGTPTPSPSPLYLPLVLRERCDPERKRADIVLVLDASSSMDGAKLAAAKDAAKAFVAQVSLPEDKVAVVAFNAEAWIVQTLTTDPRDLGASIDSITTAPGTRIDRGLHVARTELASSRRVAGHDAVIVLLTDGRQYDTPSSALEEANEARADGGGLFVIGLGDDVDEAFLETLAGNRARYTFAPGPEDLRRLYLEIAALIPCPPERFWGRR